MASIKNLNPHKDIPGYEGLYAITKNGWVWTHPKPNPNPKISTAMRPGRWMKPTLTKHGYLVVRLSNRTEHIHRMVAITFIGPAVVPKNHINHIDGNKLNNCPENLEWCTNSENVHHSWRTGLARSVARKLSFSDIRVAVKMRLLGNTLDDIGHHFGVSKSTIHNAIHKNRAYDGRKRIYK